MPPSDPSRPSTSVSGSRASSIRLRPPSSLRSPLTRFSRKASNPSLSLVFAAGDALPSPAARPGGFASEDALSKQLVNDSGGQRMGLRSRTGSSATIQSQMTGTGRIGGNMDVGEGSVAGSVVEEHEEEGMTEAAGAGKSESQRLGPPQVSNDASGEGSIRSGRTINPKKSGSWLRWNSPAPNFPRSRAASIMQTAGPQTSILNADTAATDTEHEVGQTDGAVSMGRDGQARDVGVDFPEARMDETSAPSAAVMAESQDKDDDLGRETLRSGWRAYLWGSAVKPAIPVVADRAEEPVTDPALSDHDAMATPTNPAPDVGLQQDGAFVDAVGQATTAATCPADEENKAGPATAPPLPTAPSPAIGWSRYFYSYVSTPTTGASTSIPAAESREHAVPISKASVAVDPASEVPPVPSTLLSGAALASCGPNAPTDNVSVANTAPVAAPPILEPSTSIASSQQQTPQPQGWLSYLASRAAQRKVAQAPSSTEARKSMEVGEVMDFSEDPDFPAGSTTIEGSRQAGQVKETFDDKLHDERLPKDRIPKGNGKEPQMTKAVTKAKRLSISSAHSSPQTNAVSAVPVASLASSPRSASNVPPPAVNSSNKNAKQINPASNGPVALPNVITPSFETTFDRPPRSLLPYGEKSRNPVQQQALASPEGGVGRLAWRAFTAAGSYVYGGSTDDVKVKKSNSPRNDVPALSDKKDGARGLGAARHIGADLPRRVGLRGEAEDAGWRDVKRVAVVGVHGWFPAKMLNSVLGEPTGTSQKFASMMQAAVKAFFDDKGMDDIRITLMPLEGEGTIEHRVDKLYKSYLSNPAWINDLRRADAIFFAAHSQGCIVTTHLISRMIAQGHIRTPHNRDAVARCEWAFGPIGVIPPPPSSSYTAAGRNPLSGIDKADMSDPASGLPGNEGGHQKVCLLDMCGVHLGPLYSISTSSVIQPYLQWFENAAARELFEFQESTSAVSVEYTKALSMILENGVKIVMLASLNDQVVPIYGAAFTTASHPLILRALFVDGASFHESDLMIKLISFALMLRNAGLDDQRLVEHLSEATAGSLTGLGHSTPYEESSCYALAVSYLFLTDVPRHPLPPLQIEAFSAREARNDYELPWIMRALVDSKEAKDLFADELSDLKEGVVSWKPMTKALKEIKKRRYMLILSSNRWLADKANYDSRVQPRRHRQSVASRLLSAPPVGQSLDWEL